MRGILFPVQSKWKLTADYDEERETSTGQHRAWDLGVEPETPIFAPENGNLIYHLIIRSHRTSKWDHSWQDGTYYWFSNYYYDSYGACYILLGEKRNYLFAHINLDIFFHGLLETGRNSFRIKKVNQTNIKDWCVSYLNLGDLKTIVAGEKIGYSGDDGGTSGSHIHLEVHPPGMHKWKRLDPADIWPREYAFRESIDNP